MYLQGAVAILARLGVSPNGTHVSGCRIVAEAMNTPGAKCVTEATVKRIWKQCAWRASYLPPMRKYSKAIATRQGLSHSN